jgi:hypothetical protein
LTDELYSYNLLTGDGYIHGAVKHGAKEYSRYDYRQGVIHHVNSVEGFWRLFKASIRTTHVAISPKYAALPCGVHFPREPPRARERDVRSSGGISLDARGLSHQIC